MGGYPLPVTSSAGHGKVATTSLGLDEELTRGLLQSIGPVVLSPITHEDDAGVTFAPTAGVLAGLLSRLECFESQVSGLLGRWGDRVAEESILDIEACRLESYVGGPAPLDEWRAYWAPEGTRGWLLKGLRMAQLMLAERSFENWPIPVAVLLERAEDDMVLPPRTAVREVAVLLIGAAFQYGCQLRVLRGVIQ